MQNFKRWKNFKKACFFPTISNRWGRTALYLGRDYNWATPFEFHTLPVEDLRNIVYRGSVNFKQIIHLALLGFFSKFLMGGTQNFRFPSVLLSLKVVKFDTQIYPNFSNFLGGGQALVQKWGQVLDGGVGKIFAGWESPQEKNPGHF